MTTFNESKVSNNILNKDGIVNYYGKILSSVVANQYFDLLMQNIHWEKDQVIIFGKILLLREKLHGTVILNTCILIQIQQREH
jgi:hypothetical protein